MNIKLSICLLLTISLSAQKKGDKINSGDKVLNDLITNIQQNPNNPLNVDSKSLMDVANKLPDGNLKSKLMYYSQNIGVDKDLSMRQVYYDMGEAFNRNNKIVSEAQFQNIGAGLNILLQKPEQLADKLKTITTSYGNGMFLNDPSYRAELSSALGVPMMNKDMALGATLLVTAIAGMQEEKQYKLDYKKFADMAAIMVYSEVDRNLSKSLIDAGVFKSSTQMVTALYRYDFENGTTLSVENGILVLRNMFTGLNKKLIEVPSKDDGVVDNSNRQPIYIEVSQDDESFLLTTGKNPVAESKLDKKEAYKINSLTGEAVSHKYLFNNSIYNNFNNIRQSIFDSQKLHSYIFIPDGNKIFSANVFFDGKSDFKKMDMPNGKTFLIKGEMRKALVMQSIAYGIENSDELLAMVWAYGEDGAIFGPEDLTKYSSTYTYGDKLENKKGENKGLTNKLTGIISAKNGDFFFTTANGQIGKVQGPTQNFSDLENLLSKAKITNFAKPYDFIVKENFVFNGGVYRTALPMLRLSKDEKWLVYTVDLKMYLIETADTSNIKEFDLASSPYDLFFTKENSDYVLNLMSANEFKMPIIKKYSFSKLCNSKKLPPAEASSTARNSDAASVDSSISEEIKKLKALLDDGTLTKEEFAKAKKKLLKDD